MLKRDKGLQFSVSLFSPFLYNVFNDCEFIVVRVFIIREILYYNVPQPRFNTFIRNFEFFGPNLVVAHGFFRFYILQLFLKLVFVRLKLRTRWCNPANVANIFWIEVMVNCFESFWPICVKYLFIKSAFFVSSVNNSPSSSFSGPILWSFCSRLSLFTTFQNSLLVVAFLNCSFQYSASDFRNSLVTSFLSFLYSIFSCRSFLFHCHFNRALYLLFINFLIFLVTEGNDFVFTLAVPVFTYSLITSFYINSKMFTVSSTSSKKLVIHQGVCSKDVFS